MKLKTIVIAVTAGGVGYVLGTRDGRARYEELKMRADQLAHNPKVQETVSHLADEVAKNASKLPDPVAGVVTSVAESVKRA